ncbi:MAG: hypothetical protein ACK5F7_09065 [Planctomycetaceae bacterium]|jgi:hypothetical protein
MDIQTVLDSTRSEIHAEHSLINQRLSWNLSTQSFLLTGYVIAGGGQNPLQAFILFCMPLMGILLSIMGLIGVYAAREVQEELIEHQTNLLKRELERHKGEENSDQLQICEDYAKTTCAGRRSKRKYHILAMIPPIAIPSSFIMLWLAALVVSFTIHAPTTVAPTARGSSNSMPALDARTQQESQTLRNGKDNR